jgi:putative endonuclease
MPWFVYILRCRDGSLYTGVATDVDRRFAEHRAGTGARYTRSHKPAKVVYRRKLGSRSKALKREAQIKKWPRKQKLELITRG